MKEIETDLNRMYGERIDGEYIALGIRVSAARHDLKLGERAFFYAAGERTPQGGRLGWEGTVERIGGPNGTTAYVRMDWD